MSKGENIYKRKDGRWEGRYPKGRKSNGTLYYGYIYGKTYRSVKEKIAEKKTTYYLKMSMPVNTFEGSFYDWGTFWLNEMKNDYIKSSTYTSYQSKFRVHLFPLLGEKKLNEITQQTILCTIEILEKHLSLSSVHLIFRLLSNCLEGALKKGYINENPCKRLVLPSAGKRKIEAFPLNIQEKMIDLSKKSYYYLPILLALEAGLRIGEVCGLKWEDIDFSTSVLHIRRTVQRVANQNIEKMNRTKVIEGTPKSSKGIRTIPLSKTLRTALLEARLKTQDNDVYVISNKSHTKIEPRTISYRFNQLKKELGITQGTFHMLRHSFATRCISLGGNVAAVSAMLGHSSIKMTLDTYTSSFLEDQRKIIELFS